MYILKKKKRYRGCICVFQDTWTFTLTLCDEAWLVKLSQASSSWFTFSNIDIMLRMSSSCSLSILSASKRKEGKKKKSIQIITNLITHLEISSSFGSVSATFRDHHLTDPVLTGLLLLLLPESAEVSLCSDLLKAQFRSFTNKFILHILGHDLNTRGLT